MGLNHWVWEYGSCVCVGAMGCVGWGGSGCGGGCHCSGIGVSGCGDGRSWGKTSWVSILGVIPLASRMGEGLWCGVGMGNSRGVCVGWGSVAPVSCSWLRGSSAGGGGCWVSVVVCCGC